MFLRRDASLGACAYSMLQHNWKSCDHRHSHEAQVMPAATLERRELMRHPAANGVWFTSFGVGQHNTNGCCAGWSGILRQSLWPGDTGPATRKQMYVSCQVSNPTSQGHAEEGGEAGGHADQRAVAQPRAVVPEHRPPQPRGAGRAQRCRAGVDAQGMLCWGVSFDTAAHCQMLACEDCKTEATPTQERRLGSKAATGCDGE